MPARSRLRVQLLYSQVAQIVARQEMALELPARAAETQTFFRERYATLPGTLEVYGREEWFAPVASGSNPRMPWSSALAPWARLDQLPRGWPAT